jgi:hypothetical protein
MLGSFNNQFFDIGLYSTSGSFDMSPSMLGILTLSGSMFSCLTFYHSVLSHSLFRYSTFSCPMFRSGSDRPIVCLNRHIDNHYPESLIS